jgi:hypothetical protein
MAALACTSTSTRQRDPKRELANYATVRPGRRLTIEATASA